MTTAVDNTAELATTERDGPRLPARHLLSGLFPDATARSITWAGVLLGTAVAAVLSLVRTTGTGPLQSILEEDARDILTGALDGSGLKSVLMPVQGYFVVGPRLLGEVAAFFPVSWAAAVLSICSAVICGLLAVQVYVASAAHLPNKPARLAVAAPLLLAPVAETRFMEVYNRPVCLHFFALYALFWVLLWTPPTRAGRVGALVTAGMTAVSTALIVVFLPLAAVRAYTRRDRLSVGVFALVLGGSALQFLSTAVPSIGGVTRTGHLRLDPVWALGQFAEWALPLTILGRRGAHYDPALATSEAFVPSGGGVLLAWAIVLLVVAAAALGARRGLLRPAWLLSGVLAAHSVGLLVLEIMVNAAISQRYLMAPALLLLAALVVLLRPAPGARLAMAPLAVLCAFLLAVAAVNFRSDDTFRHSSPQWTDQVRGATRWCAEDPTRGALMVNAAPAPLLSYVTIPCHELRAIEPPLPLLGR